MPTSPKDTFTNQRLDPFYPNGARGTLVRLAPSTFFPRGTVLGQISTGANKGVFAPYVSTNTDGSQTAKLILAYDVNTDASGNMTLGGSGQVGGPHGSFAQGVFAYFKGEFQVSDLTGLDSNALTGFARFVTGNLTDGGVITLL